jgi:hypothetical protein
MKFPLIGFCDGDVSVFATLDKARAEIEPPDVREGRWQVYDRAGQRLTVRIGHCPLAAWWPLSWISIECAELIETGQIDMGSVVLALRRYFESIPGETLSIPKQGLSAASYDNLVHETIRVLGEKAEKRYQKGCVENPV